MKITLPYNFSLAQIEYSGQAFRIKVFPDETYRFVYHNEVLYIRKLDIDEYEISCSMDKWNRIWAPYFDLGTDYDAIIKKIPKSDKFLYEAAHYSSGIRILKQDYFEMIITFIISQRRSIPAIKTCVEKICKKFGTKHKTRQEEIYFFPTPNQLARATIDDLKECGVGYRAAYIVDAINKIKTKEIDLVKLRSYPDDTLVDTLKQINGIGDKVANCIALFGYHRVSLAPIDTWINKVITMHYNGENPFPRYGKYAGIMQQYMFYYIRMQNVKLTP